MLMKVGGEVLFPRQLHPFLPEASALGKKGCLSCAKKEKKEKQLTKFSLLVQFNIYVKVRQRLREFQSPTPNSFLCHYHLAQGRLLI